MADGSLVSEPILRAQDLRKSFGLGDERSTVLDGISFDLQQGQFLVIVGPSGAGKTTLLRLLAGLLRPDAGQVLHRGEPATGPVPWLSVVFQEYNRSLFPWLSVRRNVGFGLRGMDSDQRTSRIASALEDVGLSDFGDHYPWQLSGGMQQRVALARALAVQSKLLLLDEPFASVDAQTRMDLEELVMALWQRLRVSALLVTHDIDEAVLMGDRVLVLSRRPATVIADITIDLDRPRDNVSTKEHPRFLELRHQVLDLVRTSARRSGTDDAEHDAVSPAARSAGSLR